MPEVNQVPSHLAIVMDGNGRWATQRGKSRHAGHREGVRAARRIVEACAERGIEELTLFAFSSENWKRPKTEVKLLMKLFSEALQREIVELHSNSIQLHFLGSRERLDARLVKHMEQGEKLTANNTRMRLNIAIAYGGRWDIAQAAKRLAQRCIEGEINPSDINEERLSQELFLHSVGEPELLIRTGGEQRISNFMIWQLAYTELFFSSALWPDFDEEELDSALQNFVARERRFGCVDDVATVNA